MRIVTLSAMIISVLALAAAIVAELPTKLVYNGSASARTGFYWIDDAPVGRGDFVLMEVPERVRKLVETRRYLPSDVPLIKRIVAAGGDEICRRKRKILLEDMTVAVARNEDRLGRYCPPGRDAGSFARIRFSCCSTTRIPLMGGISGRWTGRWSSDGRPGCRSRGRIERQRDPPQ